jgi:hypothetical protein
MMRVLVGAPFDGEQVDLILNLAPEEVPDAAQRIDFEVRQRVAITHRAHVLEAPVDGIHALHEHALFVPVAPDQFDEARFVHAGRDDAITAYAVALQPREGVGNDSPDVRKLLRTSKVVLQLFLYVPQSYELVDAGAFLAVVKERMAFVAAVLYANAALEQQEGLGRQLQQLVRADAVQVGAEVAEAAIEPSDLLQFGILGPQYAIDELPIRVEGDGARSVADGHPESLVARVMDGGALESHADLAADDVDVRLGCDRILENDRFRPSAESVRVSRDRETAKSDTSRPRKGYVVLGIRQFLDAGAPHGTELESFNFLLVVRPQ